MSNCNTSLIVVLPECQDIVKQNFLFKCAFQLAKDGNLTFVLCTKPINSLPLELQQPEVTSRPEILERILIRYFSSSNDVIKWCHKIHENINKPNAIIFNGMDEFEPTTYFEIVSICAALLDVVQFCSSPGVTTYLTVLVSSNSCNWCFKHIQHFFRKIWSTVKHDRTIILSDISCY